MLPQVLLIFPLISLELYFKIYVCCCLYVCHPNCCKTLHPVQSSHTSVKPKQVICFYVMFFITGSQIFFLLYFQICSFYPVKEISLFLSCVSSHICTFILRALIFVHLFYVQQTPSSYSFVVIGFWPIILHFQEIFGTFISNKSVFPASGLVWQHRTKCRRPGG